MKELITLAIILKISNLSNNMIVRLTVIVISLFFASCATPLYTNQSSIVVYKDRMKSDSLVIPPDILWTAVVPIQARKYNLRAIAIVDTTNVVADKRWVKPLGFWKRVGFDSYYIIPAQLKELFINSRRAVVHNKMLNASAGRKSYELFLEWNKNSSTKDH